jgi:hypothetical protein
MTEDSKPRSETGHGEVPADFPAPVERQADAAAWPGEVKGLLRRHLR